MPNPWNLSRVLANLTESARSCVSSLEVEESTKRAAKLGATLGLVVLSLLVAFPGPPARGRYGEDAKPGNRDAGGSGWARALTWACLAGGAMYVANGEYDGFALEWFARAFPREARTLGVA